MSNRTKLIEKYFKSDIFNLSLPQINPNQTTSNIQQSLNNTFDSTNQNNNQTKPLNQKKVSFNQKKYIRKHHESDIFNINNTIPKIDQSKTRRYINNKSTCFDSMKDNIKYKNDLKEYTNQIRSKKIDYNPNKYFNNENAASRLYNQFYDKSRNPILFQNKNKSMMKSSTNLLSNVDLNKDNNDNDINKTLFLDKRKKIGNEFSKITFGIRNLDDKIKLEKETEQARKLHKFYKSKGFTYNDNDGYNLNKKRFITIDNNYDNCKINKQLELQSNIFNTLDKENLQKNENDLNEIKQRIKLAEKNDETKPKKAFILNKNINKNSNHVNDNNNINTDITSKKNKTIINMNLTPFQRKINQLTESNNIDNMNDLTKYNNKNNNLNKTKYISNLEQIDEILNDIPNNLLKSDKKKQILFHANTVSLGEEGDADKNILNYKKYIQNGANKKKNKEPKIKILSKESQNHVNNKINSDKNYNNLKKYDNYSIHDYIISYDTKNINEKNNFDNFSENQVKLLFSKNGLHIYDIQKNMFDNGKYNVIKFKVRENDGDKILDEKIKDIENKFNQKDYKIKIKKEEEKNRKKNLRNVAKAPWSKNHIFVDNIDNKNNVKNKNKENNNKKNMAFSNKYISINNNYKNHYKEQREKDRVNKQK